MQGNMTYHCSKSLVTQKKKKKKKERTAKDVRTDILSVFMTFILM